MSQHIAMRMAYEGTHLIGWQKNFSGQSVEGHLLLVLEKILKNPVQAPIQLQAASRTDAGVHASAQVVDFILEHPVDLKRLQKSLNGLLPRSIRILEIVEVMGDFHSTLDAKAKTYHYHLWNGWVQPPHLRRYSWQVGDSLDVSLMQQAALLLVGRHNFESLCNNRSRMVYQDYHRTLIEVKVEVNDEQKEKIKITMRGTSFLYRMARNFVGLLLEFAKKQMQLDELNEVLKGRDRKKAGLTAPAHGLFLDRVFYEEKNPFFKLIEDDRQ